MAWFLVGLFGGVVLGWYFGGVLLLRKHRRAILEEPYQMTLPQFEELIQTATTDLSLNDPVITKYVMPVGDAKFHKVCRVCGGPAEPRIVNGVIDPFVLGFGNEYAHKSCIGEKHEG